MVEEHDLPLALDVDQVFGGELTGVLLDSGGGEDDLAFYELEEGVLGVLEELACVLLVEHSLELLVR